MDISSETKETLDMYGPDATKPGTYAYSRQARMVERDVRFTCRSSIAAGTSTATSAATCRNRPKISTQASWALIRTSSSATCWRTRWSSGAAEFGRTVYCQGNLTRENYGRDHHPRHALLDLDGRRRQAGRRVRRDRRLQLQHRQNRSTSTTWYDDPCNAQASTTNA